MMTYHSRPLLDREISAVYDNIQRLSSMVLTALDNAMRALYERQVQLAQEVIDSDLEVNALRFAIEEDCLRILATQQPAAIDLRIIVAATHIAGELERVGDHAASIADVVSRVDVEEPFDSLHKLPKMAQHARLMIEASIDAFIQQDPELAHDLMRREGKMHKHYQNLFDETILEMQDDAYIQRGTFLLWVGRHLERIGDRATNIAERVIFVTTGRFVEIG